MHEKGVPVGTFFCSCIRRGLNYSMHYWKREHIENLKVKVHVSFSKIEERRMKKRRRKEAIEYRATKWKRKHIERRERESKSLKNTGIENLT